jgi:lipopolysaccharide export system protein LptA
MSFAPRLRRWNLRARGARRATLLACAWFCFAATAAAQDAITLPRAEDDAPIRIAADQAEHWQQGVYDVWHLSGNCRVRQGETDIRGPEAVLWIDRADPNEPNEPDAPARVLAYFERGPQQPLTLDHAATKAESGGNRLETPTWFGRLITRGEVELQLPPPLPAPTVAPPIVARGLARFGPRPHVVKLPTATADAVQQAQFTQAVPTPTPLVPAGAAPFRKFRVLQRSDVGFQFKTLKSPAGEDIVVVGGGVNVIIEGLSVEGLPASFGPLGTVDIETDRAVVWTRLPGGGGNVNEVTQQNDAPLEIYMEGNIVFRQGDRTVYADRMFYDARRQVGTILNAELITPPPAVAGYQYQGLVRLKAAAVRQLDASRFVASDALLTTSRLEDPAYSFESQTITLTDRQQPLVDPYTGAMGVNPATGEPAFAHQYSVESRSNFLYVSGVPVFYWPTIATTLDKPTFYVNNVRVRNDSIFGFQTLFDLDAFQLLGYEAPQGVEWDLNLDYLSKRGLGFGTSVEYDRDSFFNLLGPTTGLANAWFISDHGLDNLGLGRRDIVPEKSFRGRAFWNHRQKLVGGMLDDWTVQGEAGWLSDRTFLEEYYENEWDENKDQTTGVRLKRVFDNMSLSVAANGRINDFFTETQWLPRGDFYWLGESLFDDRTTFYSHTSAAYANIGIATPPTNPTLLSQWTLLPWESLPGIGPPFVPIEAQGERFVTRNEFDYPIDLAPFKVVPYVLGEYGHWGADLNGDSIDRLWGQVGVRASIPFWAVDPTIHDPLFNLNGLAHKVVFDGEASYADANQDFDEFPLYDEIDDDAIEEFRRRLFFSPVGSSVLAGQFNRKFDPRYWAIRSGIQDDVTATSMELADDLTTVRLGMRQRLQTKRGAPGEERIVDWMTFDSNATWFPNPNRDNFGQDVGLIDYDWRWHIGDRFTILSDGAADTFGNGFKTVSLGGMLNRPMIGNAYLGFRAMDGPFTANLVLGSINYRMSQKWIGSASGSIDLGNTGNIGQSFSVSRIGESLIATVGANYDQSKDNIGLSFLVEPRFLPSLNVTRRTGIEIPPAGINGLE